MSIVDRYLHSVKFWLPGKQQDDILAELSEDILSQVADEETRLGRELTESELVDILKQRGDPMLLAGRYLPHQHLIGPPWFPIYVFVLEVVLLWVLLPLFVLMAVTGPALDIPHDHGAALLRTLGGFWTGALSAFALITIGFALLDRFSKRLESKEWDPRKLPAVPTSRDSRKIPRPGSVAELIWGIVFALWWANLLIVPTIPGNQVRVAMTAAWAPFFWPVLAVSIATVALACANVARPWWSQLRAGIRLGIDAANLVIAALLMRSGLLLHLTAAGISEDKLEQLRRAAESGLQVALAIFATISVFGCFQHLRRIISETRGAADLRGKSAGSF
jgi:hypothetical protein